MQNPLKAIIVEDELPARELIESYIKKIPSLCLVGIFDNAYDALTFLSINQVDILISDIRLPRLSGLDLLRSLRNKPFTIIVTANPEYALDGFELEVVDFLVKPVPFERFFRAINKVMNLLDNSSKVFESKPENEPEFTISSIYVKDSGRIVRIDFDEIIAVEALKDYVKIISNDRTVVTHLTMKKMEEEILPKGKFMRVHKSFIIKMNMIRIWDSTNNRVEMNNKIQIPVSRDYRDELLKKIKPIN